MGDMATIWHNDHSATFFEDGAGSRAGKAKGWFRAPDGRCWRFMATLDAAGRIVPGTLLVQPARAAAWMMAPPAVEAAARELAARARWLHLRRLAAAVG